MIIAYPPTLSQAIHKRFFGLNNTDKYLKLLPTAVVLGAAVNVNNNPSVTELDLSDAESNVPLKVTEATL